MGELLGRVRNLLTGAGWAWAAVITVVLAVGSVVLAGVVVVSWAPNRFKIDGNEAFLKGGHPVLRFLGLAGKNVAGVLLILLGVIMSLPGVPGQGVLVILIGLTLVDFPGKRRLELWFIRRPTLLTAINRLRARFHRAALDLP